MWAEFIYFLFFFLTQTKQRKSNIHLPVVTALIDSFYSSSVVARVHAFRFGENTPYKQICIQVNTQITMGGNRGLGK